jgi:hypothetical protein
LEIKIKEGEDEAPNDELNLYLRKLILSCVVPELFSRAF